MPTPRKKNDEKELSLEETIILTLEVINAEIPDFDAMRKHVCAFYKGGNEPGCVGCAQKDQTVLECGQDYADKIHSRPMRVWSPEFDRIKAREKVALVGDVEIGLYCDRCYMNETCPMYEKMALCSIDFSNPDVDATSPNSIVDYLIKMQMERVERAKLIEQIDGGVPDMTLSNEMDRLTSLLAQKADINSVKFKVSMEGSAPSNANAGGGGILSKIFGNLGAGGDKALPEKTEDAESTEITRIPIPVLKQPEFEEPKKSKRHNKNEE